MTSQFIPWEVFKADLIRHVGSKRSQTIFSEATGFRPTVMAAWRRADQVPLEAYEMIEGIVAEEADTCRFKGYHSQRFFNRVVELSNERRAIREIAETLSQEMGRKITEGAIKSARFRMKDQIPTYRSRSD